MLLTIGLSSGNYTLLKFFYDVKDEFLMSYNGVPKETLLIASDLVSETILDLRLSVYFLDSSSSLNRSK